MISLFRPVLTSIGLLNRRQKVTYFGLAVARVVTNFFDVAGLAGVALFGSMVAANLSGRDSVEFGGVVLEFGDSSVFLWVILAVVGFFLLKSTIATVLLRANGLFLARVESDASSEAFEYIFGDDLSRVKRYSQSQVQWTISSSTAMAFSYLLTNFNVLMTEASLFLFVFLAFSVVDFHTALIITLYFLILLGGFQLVINRRLVSAGHLLAENSKKVTRTFLDLSRAFKELFVLSRVDTFINNFREYRYLEARTFARVRFFDGFPRFFVESALMVGVLALVGWQFLRGDLAEGLTVTVVFMAGGVRMMGALLPLQNAVSWMKVNGPQARDAQEILLEVRSLQKESTASATSKKKFAGSQVFDTVPQVDSAVNLENISFAYPDSDEPVVVDVSCKIHRGAFVAFVGPSGAGKTTLVDLILGVLSPDSGNVSVFGSTPAEVRKASRGLVSYVPQKPGMVTGSIAENVALGVPIEQIDQDRVTEVLSAVGLLEELPSSERGIFADLGTHADSLSGGQLQRLGLARALYTKPQLIVLDEATSALDAGAEAEITSQISQLRGHTTIIVIAHRLSTIQHVDKVFVVEGGKISASGTFKEVRKKVPLIEQYVKLMSFDED